MKPDRQIYQSFTTKPFTMVLKYSNGRKPIAKVNLSTAAEEMGEIEWLSSRLTLSQRREVELIRDIAVSRFQKYALKQ